MGSHVIADNAVVLTGCSGAGAAVMLTGCSGADAAVSCHQEPAEFCWHPFDADGGVRISAYCHHVAEPSGGLIQPCENCQPCEADPAGSDDHSGQFANAVEEEAFHP